MYGKYNFVKIKLFDVYIFLTIKTVKKITTTKKKTETQKMKTFFLLGNCLAVTSFIY